VTERTREPAAIQDVTILVMASLAGTRDSAIGKRICRMQYYVKALAEKHNTHARFSAFLTMHGIAGM